MGKKKLLSLWVLVPVILFAVFSDGVGASQAPTNMSIMEGLANAVAKDLLKDIPLEEGATVELACLSAGDGSWVLEDALASFLKKSRKDIQVKVVRVDSLAARADTARTIPGPDPPAAGFRLEYRIVELSLDYARSWKKHIVGSSVVERVGKANVHARLVNGATGELLWTGNDEKQARDVLSVRALPSVEGKSFPFQKPTLQRKGMGRFLEPVLVAGIVVGLISLFYSAK